MAFAGINGQKIFFDDSGGDGPPVGSDGVVQVPGAHAANLTHPEPVNAAIVQFLAALPH